MPYTEVKVVDPVTGDEASAGASGEIVVRGPNVTPGYWANPEATSSAFDDAGWFHTGDIGYLDDGGYLYIVDRLKDMVISGGENVYPAEVERALADLPGLGDVAVSGARDDRWGEVVVAVVSVLDGVDITLEDIRAHSAARLARYKLPHRLEIVEAVPATRPASSTSSLSASWWGRVVSDADDLRQGAPLRYLRSFTEGLRSPDPV